MEPRSAWEAGQFDSGRGAPRVLFGRMYEDAAIEHAAFSPGGRILCIASAGCTAISLAREHEVVAVDINPAQLEYAAKRVAGAPATAGSAERLMQVGRALFPLAGWTRSILGTFLDFDDPAPQLDFWQRHLDTRRFRAGLDILLSVASLRTAYAPQLLASLPPRFGAVMRSRMERCFGVHPNRTNPFARALLAGEVADEPPPGEARTIEFVCANAAAYLEGAPSGSFDGFTLSNILDGADPMYRQRIGRAVARTGRPGALVVLRSFGEPPIDAPFNRAAEDRAMLWGIVDVRPAEAYRE